MRTLAFDGRMGASGDMILASLLDAGGDPAALRPVETTLDVRYERGSVMKAGIAATTVDVLVSEASRPGDDLEDAPGVDGEGHSQGGGHAPDESQTHDEGHSHDGTHAHDEGHSHDGTHAHDEDNSRGEDGPHRHAEGRGPHRTLAEVQDILDEMEVPASVRREAGAIFDRLAAAEAAVHGTDPADTHFHEVGADDAIADVVGACLLLADLAPDRVVTTPLSVGGGEATMRHGTYPVPAPAVMELAGTADWSVRGGPVDRELLTPTGAAVLAHVADGVDRLPALRVESTGYGAGGYDLPDRPNVLRTVVGDGGGRLDRDEITVLETNLDDASPEVLGDLQRSLSTVGARDVTILPATMKKSRPGHLVKVIVKPEDAARVARKLAEETGTLGVREHGAGHRWVARRRMETVELDLEGATVAVAVKVATDESGTVVDVSAEYDDAADAASDTSLPVREVMRRAENRVADRLWSTDDE